MDRRHLTDFELMILLAILRIGEDAYGVPIAREIEETGRRRVLVAAIYAALDRLEDNGLVTSSFGDPTPERGGRSKRFFKVTAKGLKAVKETQASARAFIGRVLLALFDADRSRSVGPDGPTSWHTSISAPSPAAR